MHLMTRVPPGAEIHAPFGWRGRRAATFRFKDDTARLVERDGARYVELTSAQYGDHRYRVTRVIGGRYREDFAGVEEGAPTRASCCCRSRTCSKRKAFA